MAWPSSCPLPSQCSWEGAEPRGMTPWPGASVWGTRPCVWQVGQPSSGLGHGSLPFSLCLVSAGQTAGGLVPGLGVNAVAWSRRSEQGIPELACPWAGFPSIILCLSAPAVRLSKLGTLEHELRLSVKMLFKMLPWMLTFQKTKMEMLGSVPKCSLGKVWASGLLGRTSWLPSSRAAWASPHPRERWPPGNISCL